MIIGCQRVSDRDWQFRYEQTRKKLWSGYFEEALREASRNYHESENQSPTWSWQFQTLRAQGLLFTGKSNEALQLLNSDIPTTIPGDVRAAAKIVQADAFCRLGQAQHAEPLLSNAENLITSVGYYRLRAEMALARGRCALLTNREMAKNFYILAAQLAHGHDEFVEATGLLNLGVALLQQQRYDEAADEFQKGLKITASPLLKEKLLGSLGYAYCQLGAFQRAIPLSVQAESLATKLHNDRDQTKWLIDLGREHFHQLDYADAEKYFAQALALSSQLQDKDNSSTCVHDLAQLALLTNNLKKAEGYTRELEALKPGGTHFLDLLLDQAELAKGRGDFPVAERLLKELLQRMEKEPGTEATTRWSAESDLAIVYDEEGKFDSAEGMFKKTVTTAVEARRKCGGVECRISFLDQAPFFDRYVKFLVSRSRPLEALDVAELGRSPTLSESLEQGARNFSRGAGLRTLQKRLAMQHIVALAYWLGWEESYLWAITPSDIELFRLPAEPKIEKEAEAYTRAILDRDEAAESQRGAKLYDILVRPAAALIPPGTNVVIVPHRKLYNLNFETIVVPDPKPHYWIEDVRLQNASFLGALAGRSAKTSTDPEKKMLLMGAPVLADKQFPQLKFANEEVKKVSTHFPLGEQTVFTGKQATPEAYLDGNPGQYDLLHFVTHGTSSTVAESPLDAAIILSPTSGNSSASTDPEGSYRLYGKEIMKTPLHADLVTVSACYGLGREYSGEGLVGLAWAFLRAGAHQVIAALWEVDDASSPQLMDDFYSELTQGKAAAEALRDAKLKMLHSSDFHRHPYYWASLQLYTGS